VRTQGNPPPPTHTHTHTRPQSSAMKASSMSLLKTIVSYSHFREGSLLRTVTCIIMLACKYVSRLAFVVTRTPLTCTFILHKHLFQVAYTRRFSMNSRIMFHSLSLVCTLNVLHTHTHTYILSNSIHHTLVTLINQKHRTC
jgi:hypothetical protein